MKFTLTKELKLIKTNQFNFVFQQNKKLSISNIILLSRLNIVKYPRLGISISKKKIKKSHERNRIKRIIRESFRLNQHIIFYMDFIFIVKKNIIHLNNNIIIETLEKLWKRYYIIN